jgi:hypothetical protein
MASNDSTAKSHAEHALETIYGEKDAPFSEEEFADRLRRVRQEMAKREIDTLIVSDPANLYDRGARWQHRLRDPARSTRGDHEAVRPVGMSETVCVGPGADRRVNVPVAFPSWDFCRAPSLRAAELS